MSKSAWKDIADVFGVMFKILGGIVCVGMIIVGIFMALTGKPQVMYIGRKWLNELWDLGWDID